MGGFLSLELAFEPADDERVYGLGGPLAYV